MPRADYSSRTRWRRGGQPSVLVVCGGQTEYTYLTNLVRRSGAAAGVTVRIRAQDPISLVSYAARLNAHQGTAYDKAWCVVDVDDFDIGAAAVLARRRGVELVVSNPCFELWLLLHYEDCRAYVDGYPGAVQRLRRHLPAYDKNRLRFADFADGVFSAVKRAKTLDPERNPSTGMWRLVERIVQQ